MNALQIAIDFAGSQAKLAEMIGTTQQHISHWITKGKEVPAKYAIRIEKVTGGRVTKEVLCPDTFMETTVA